MWGIIPSAGRGTRIQPLAFSKELLPVGSRADGARERPVAVSEYLVDRMVVAGVSKLCFVVSPGKSDILEYYGGQLRGIHICYAVQNEPTGLCDALFCALPFIADDESVLVGLPDTIWFPEDGFVALTESAHDLEFLLFPVEHPELFDAVSSDETGRVQRIEVKNPTPSTGWVWGAFKVRASVLRELHRLWQEPGRGDEYVGTLINAYIEKGGQAHAVQKGHSYVDVGTLNGYREATRLLDAIQLVEGTRFPHADRARGAPRGEITAERRREHR